MTGHINKPIEKEVVDIDSSSFARFAGQYVNKEDELEVNVIDNQLFIDFKNGLSTLRLFPSGKCTFFVQQDDVTIEFLNCEGKPNSLALIDSKGVKTIFNKK